jgi:hypothetical protein
LETDVAYKVGDLLTDRINPLLPDGEPATGLVFTSDHVVIVNPAAEVLPFSRLTITELPDGAGYDFSLQTYTGTDAPGTYSIHIERPDEWPQTFSVEWDVAPKLLLPPGGISRATLRHMVLARFGDVLTVTATQDGTTDTFIDENNLVLQPRMFKGREAIFVSGQPELRGLVRYIDDSSRDQRAMHFSYPLPVATAIGDVMDVTNAHSIGATIQAVHNAINYAIAIAQDYALVPVAYDLIDAFDGSSSHRFTLPDEFVGIEDVLSLQTNGEWTPVSRAGGPGQYGWYPEFSLKAVSINGWVGSAAHEKYLRVAGYMLPQELTVDTDETTIDREWLVNTATAHLALDVVRSIQTSGGWDQKGLMWQSRADAMLARLTPNIGPSFQRFA